MTVPGATAYRGPNPDCALCAGTGHDDLFDTRCTECWRPVRGVATARRLDQHLRPTVARHLRQVYIDPLVEEHRDNMRRAAWKRQSDRAAWKRSHPLTMRFIRMMNP